MNRFARRGAAGAACFVALFSPKVAAAESAAEKGLEISRLADGVYAAIWQAPLTNPIEGNALFIVNDEDVVVVDSSLFPSSARRMIDEIEKLTDKPVRYLVNTHWHDDHHGGNAVYRERWPGVAIISHPATRDSILELVYAKRPGMVEQYRQALAKLGRWSETGVDDDGKAIEGSRRERLDQAISLYATAIAELESMRDMPPDLTVADRVVLRRGERTIEVRWLGLGNTAGDLVVFLPRERVVATGDLIVHPVPFFIGSFYEEWIATLETLDGLEADVLVPGHGPVMRDRDYLRTVQALLRDLVAEAQKAAEAGWTLDEAKERIRLAEWRERLAGDEAERQRAFDAYLLAPAVERAFRLAKGEDVPEGRLE